MLSNTRRSHFIEYSILRDAKPEGPAIGKLDGREFSEFVLDEFGQLFAYSGVAPRLSNGQFDDAALKDGEFIVPPGLIYEYRGREKSGERHRQDQRRQSPLCVFRRNGMRGGAWFLTAAAQRVISRRAVRPRRSAWRSAG